MESHSFSEAVPAAREAPKGDGADGGLPTWNVQVWRRGVGVGTLVINERTLPPRKTRKGGCWKLPSSTDVIPRFGEHEKKRLWELYKKQKKERRRQPPKQSGGGSQKDDDNDDGHDNNNSDNDYTNSHSQSHSVLDHNNHTNRNDNASFAVEEVSKSMANIMSAVAAEPSLESENGVPVAEENTVAADTVPNTVRFDKVAYVTTNPPPPSMAAATTDLASAAALLAPGGTQLYLHNNNNQRLVPSFPATADPVVVSTLASPTVPLSPPPGFGTALSRTTTPKATTAMSNSTTSRSLELSTPLGHPSEGMLVPPPFSAPQPEPPQRYFAVPTVTAATVDPLTVLGTVVATTFVRTVCASSSAVVVVAGSGGHPRNITHHRNARLGEWLSHYAPTAKKSLLVGSAQATCHTSLERQQQWQSLVLAKNSGDSNSNSTGDGADSIWECHGWTVQPVASLSTTTTNNINNSSNKHDVTDDRSSAAALVVLTGRTLPTITAGWLSYTLTLLLWPSPSAPPCTGTTTVPPPPQQQQYVIVNDVLTLFALSPLPAT